MLPYPHQPQQHPGFPAQHLPPFPHTPNHSRAIASLPSHGRHMHAMPTPTHRSQATPAKPQTPSTMLQHRPSSTRLPQLPADASVPFKRPKTVGDGFEAPYLVPGPSNRILLSLKSGLPSQIDWALSRLVSLTSGHRDQASREFTLDSVPGLTDALLSYVRRIHAALTDQHPSLWAAPYFEQPVDTPDAGIGAPGDGGHQGLSTSQQISSTNSLSAQVNRLDSRRVPRSTSDVSHAVLMRRALEAALSLRNLALHSSNVRSLASTKGIFNLIRDVLQLPITAVHPHGHSNLASDSQHEDGWCEIEGIAELRLYFLDLLETLASKVLLTKRAPPLTLASPTPSHVNGHGHGQSSAVGQARQLKTDATTASDDIFATLLSLALHSNDRAMLLGSMRCLTTMAANERNELAFVEVTLADGQQSPGLLQRCVELLPLTQDTELLDGALDLMYQLVCIGNNAIKIAASPVSDAPRRVSSAKSKNKASASPNASHSFSVHASAKTAALVRLLSRNLQLGRSMWERLIPLRVPNSWLSDIPSRQVETMRRRRELEIRIANETPQERAKRKRLTPQERQSLAGLKEPERGIAWMKMVFQRDQAQEVTQMEFWTAYKEEFGQQIDVPLQPAAELIRTVSQVIPNASAMVVPAQDGKPQRFVIRGIAVKERDPEKLEPFRCHWSTCPAAQTNSLESQRSHAKLHAEYASDGRCRWRQCDFDVKLSCGAAATAQDHKRVLVAHVLTHLKSDDAETRLAKPSKRRADIVVDDDLRIVSGATHTGEAVQLLTAKVNGARMLRGKRDSEGVETVFTLAKAATQAKGDANRQVNRHTATTNGAPSNGTIDNPGCYILDVTRTPTVGNEDNPSPQGPAYTSILILRMLARRAASLLQKAGSKQNAEVQLKEDAASIRGQGDEKFGLPLPANFGSSDRAKRGEVGDTNQANGYAAGDISGLDEEDEDYECTAAWAVEAATRLLDAVQGVEEELMHHSSQNDILSSYINDTLVELHRRPDDAPSGSSLAEVDPQLA